MSHSRRITPVKDAIKYIEGCGWKFVNFQFGSYWFTSTTRRNMSGNSTIPFTLTELRDAHNNGW